jgi:preprotein translocase subunit SecA
MAGRGTDIALGGEKPEKSHFESEAAYQQALSEWQKHQEEIKNLGGLFVIGGERNGIRRVDNQLAGRCARQGDPGEVQFYLSLEDELLKLFATDKMRERMVIAIESMGGEMSGSLLSKMLDSAQQRVENQGFSARKELMKYDGVLAKQREVLFDFQNELLAEGGALSYLEASLRESVSNWMALHMPEDGDVMTWDATALKQSFMNHFGVDLPIYKWLFVDNWSVAAIEEEALSLTLSYLESLNLSEEFVREVVFSNIKDLWPDHLTAVYNLRESSGYASVIGKNPVLVFQEAAFEAFTSFNDTLTYEVISQIMSVSARQQKELEREALLMKQEAFNKVMTVLQSRWISRNELCPCGSGLKYKHCHGKDAPL